MNEFDRSRSLLHRVADLTIPSMTFFFLILILVVSINGCIDEYCAPLIGPRLSTSLTPEKFRLKTFQEIGDYKSNQKQQQQQQQQHQI